MAINISRDMLRRFLSGCQSSLAQYSAQPTLEVTSRQTRLPFFSANMVEKTDTYADVMQRNKLASERLRFQLFLWRVRYGWSLAPSVPLQHSEGWEVADVATGSGNWLLDVAGEFPNAKFVGLDISADQFPIPESLPSHVSFVGGFDIYQDVPEEYVGRFNVVHARLLFGAVRKNDPLPILKNFIKMLKPGGFLVWDDLNVANHFKHDINEPGMPGRKIEFPGKFSMPGGHWLDNLEQSYKDYGLVDVVAHEEPVAPEWIKPWNHLVAWGAEEHLNTLLEKCDEEDPKVKTIRSHLKFAREDSARGLFTTYTPTIVSGMRPL